jgi:hypothetical protein
MHKLSSCSYVRQYTISLRYTTKSLLIRDFTLRLLNNSSKGLDQLTNKFPAVLFLAFMLGATSSWAVYVDIATTGLEQPVIPLSKSNLISQAG